MKRRNVNFITGSNAVDFEEDINRFMDTHECIDIKHAVHGYGEDNEYSLFTALMVYEWDDNENNSAT